MASSPDELRKQIGDTRAALEHKLALLEARTAGAAAAAKVQAGALARHTAAFALFFTVFLLVRRRSG